MSTGSSGAQGSSLSDILRDNVGSIQEFYSAEEKQVSRGQRIAESLGVWMGRPTFLLLSGVFALAWIAVNLVDRAAGRTPFDPPPFAGLEFLVSCLAFVVTTTVLIRQNRLGQLEARRANLELQVNLLSEQKASKIIHLIEELRADLPAVRNRHDPQAEGLKEGIDPHSVLSALEEAGAEKAAGDADESVERESLFQQAARRITGTDRGNNQGSDGRRDRATGKT